ncbi:hypothetical protein DICVIV_02825 [Dictyocaulus viviparus]|uniref:Uncharacterized protein n=1 Tax=Dictyocaulus viviparus TaxID=29172 RepID=A0A0D8Y453_DICVI|nr:hypothetical protein DICVIV_02825 [Dictyocaulus viviparus]
MKDADDDRRIIDITTQIEHCWCENTVADDEKLVRERVCACFTRANPVNHSEIWDQGTARRDWNKKNPIVYHNLVIFEAEKLRKNMTQGISRFTTISEFSRRTCTSSISSTTENGFFLFTITNTWCWSTKGERYSGWTRQFRKGTQCQSIDR